MKVWIVLEHLGSYDDSYTRVACVFDSEDKANAFKEKEKQKQNTLELELAYCRECSLPDDIDNYIFLCQDVEEQPDEKIINDMAERFKRKHKCPCKISPYSEGDYQFGVVCDHRISLSHEINETGYYSITPMEVQ